MKTAVYIEGGVSQIVLTPENDWEKIVLDRFSRYPSCEAGVEIFRGGFYECRGGWVRQGYDQQSVILRLK